MGQGAWLSGVGLNGGVLRGLITVLVVARNQGPLTLVGCNLDIVIARQARRIHGNGHRRITIWQVFRYLNQGNFPDNRPALR